jgi:hypothetical protein
MSQLEFVLVTNLFDFFIFVLVKALKVILNVLQGLSFFLTNVCDRVSRYHEERLFVFQRNKLRRKNIDAIVKKNI